MSYAPAVPTAENALAQGLRTHRSGLSLPVAPGGGLPPAPG